MIPQIHYWQYRVGRVQRITTTYGAWEVHPAPDGSWSARRYSTDGQYAGAVARRCRTALEARHRCLEDLLSRHEDTRARAVTGGWMIAQAREAATK